MGARSSAEPTSTAMTRLHDIVSTKHFKKEAIFSKRRYSEKGEYSKTVLSMTSAGRLLIYPPSRSISPRSQMGGMNPLRLMLARVYLQRWPVRMTSMRLCVILVTMQKVLSQLSSICWCSPRHRCSTVLNSFPVNHDANGYVRSKN